MSLISIIVPVYNVEKLLPRCIESILNQTYKNIEVILINDGSTDESGRICEEYKKKDSRIKVIHQKNQGVSIARNKGIENSNGEFIGFVDSDDYIDKDMYEFLIKNAIENDADISICGFKQLDLSGSIVYNFDSNRNDTFNNSEVINRFFIDDYFKQLMYAPWNKIYKKELLERVKFDSKLRIGEDILFVFMCVDLSKTVCINDACKYNYIVRENSAMTSRFSEKRFDYIRAINRIKQICENKYPDIYEDIDLLIYTNTLITYRKIIMNKVYKEQCKEIKIYLRENKSRFFDRMNVKRKIDYLMLLYIPYIYGFVLKLKNI